MTISSYSLTLNYSLYLHEIVLFYLNPFYFTVTFAQNFLLTQWKLLLLEATMVHQLVL